MPKPISSPLFGVANANETRHTSAKPEAKSKRKKPSTKPKSSHAPSSKDASSDAPSTPARKSKRSKTNGIAVTPRTKRARKQVVDMAARNLMETMSGKARAEHYGTFPDKLVALQRIHPWITGDQIRGRIRTINQKEKKELKKLAAAVTQCQRVQASNNTTGDTNNEVTDKTSEENDDDYMLDDDDTVVEEESNARILYNLCKGAIPALDTELTPLKLGELVLDTLLANENEFEDQDDEEITGIFQMKMWDALNGLVDTRDLAFVFTLSAMAPDLLVDDNLDKEALLRLQYEDEYGPPAKNQGGKKKGATKEAANNLTIRKKRAVDELSKRYRKVREECTDIYLPKGTFSKLRKEVANDFQLSESDFNPSQHRIRKRFRNKVSSDNRNRSVVHEIEPMLLMFVLQKHEARQPITPKEGLELANSMIDGKQYQVRLREWQAKRKRKVTGKLTKKFWSGFMKRHKDKIDSAKGYRFSANKDAWTTAENIEQMYDMVYNSWVDAGVARKLPEEEHYWVNDKGERVDNEEEAVGCKVTIELTHPQMVLFGDEVGTDVCQEDDGHVGGQTFVVPKRTRAELKSSTKTSRWTSIGLTAATGEPVMSVIIFAAEKIDARIKLGFDLRAENPYDENLDWEHQKGPGKAFPGAPTCTFRGKKIPPLVTCTPSGSITSEILQKVFKRLDDLGVYERVEGGPSPCGLFDAHDSRLQLPFLRYINEKVPYGSELRPRWRFTIGLPNATHVWQVGDSNYQNGNWKVACTREKDDIIKWKDRHFMDPVIEQYDIIPIVNCAWPESFGVQVNNIKAIRERGWNPLNQALVKHPDILRRSQTVAALAHARDESNNDDPSPSSFASFNFEEGLAGDLASDFMQYINKNATIKKKSVERYEQAKIEKGRLDHSSRLTGGYLFRAGKCELDDEVLAMREFKEAEKTEKRTSVIKNAIKTYHQYHDAYLQLLRSGKSPDAYNAGDHKVFIRMVKRKGDVAMPKGAPGKKQMYLEMKDRAIPSLDQYLLDRNYPRNEFMPVHQQILEEQLNNAENTNQQAEDDNNNDADELVANDIDPALTATTAAIAEALGVMPPLPPPPLSITPPLPTAIAIPPAASTLNVQPQISRTRRDSAITGQERVRMAMASGGMDHGKEDSM